MARGLYLLLLTFLPAIAYATTPTLHLNGSNTDINLLPYLNFYQDNYKHPEVRVPPGSGILDKFTPVGKNSFYRTPGFHNYWFHFTVQNQSEELVWYLNIDYAPIGKADIYLIDDQGEVDTLFTGGNDLPGRTFMEDKSGIIAKMRLENGNSYSVLVNIQSSAYIILPITLKTADEILQSTTKKGRYLYSLLTIILISVIINLFSYFRTREMAYLILAVSILSYLLSMGFQSGIEFFPSLGEFLKTRMRTLFFGLAMLLFSCFTIRYLETKMLPELDRILKTAMIFYTVYILLILTPWVPLPFMNLITPYINTLSFTLFSLAGYYGIKHEVRASSYYLTFTLGLFFASLAWVLRVNDLLPQNAAISILNLFLITVFILMITMGLSDKIDLLSREIVENELFRSLNEQLSKEIEDRKLIENVLRESEGKFRLLFNLIPQPVFVTEIESGKILEINKAVTDVLGHRPEDTIGKTSVEKNLISQDEREKIISALKVKKSIAEIELKIRTIHNEEKIFQSFGRFVDLQDQSLTLWILMDVTSLRKSVSAIRKLSTAIDKTANSVIITNANAEIEYVNEYFTNLTGYSATEVIGKNPRFLQSGTLGESFYREIWQTINKGETWQGEFLNRKKNGEQYWEAATITPILDDEGYITNFIAIKQDITVQKMQMELIKTSESKLRELNAAKDKFFSIVGHDLMDPFNALYGFSNILVESIHKEDKEECMDYALGIQQSAHRILSLLQNLLTWSRTQSRQQSFKPKETRIGVLFADNILALLPTAQNKNITIVPEYETDLIITADPNMMGAILRNLTSNAIKFTPKGGKIMVSAKRSGTELHVSVKDNGIGIREEYLNQLFRLDKTFSSRGTENESGTGLGLVICKEFVDYHKGKIWVESQPGQGTTVHFTIPLNREQPS